MPRLRGKVQAVGTELKRLKVSQVPQARNLILKKQNGRCALCDQPVGGRAKKKPALDHDHITGYIRDVLCINCNGIEGKVFNLARRAKADLTEIEWLGKLVAYLERHKTPQHGGYFHPTHKTAEEKRLAKNKKARDKRARAKKA